MMVHRAAAVLFCLLMSLPLRASPVNELVPGAQLVGEARYAYLFWDVYDIALYAPQGLWKDSTPFALTLTYLREFTGEQIARRSLKEMRDQGLQDNLMAERWLGNMLRLFPDVKENQSLTGVLDQQGISHFFLDGEPLGIIEDPEFGRWFFNIWLGERTSEPDLRQALLQGANS